jgi:hypothetical protein
MYNNEDDENDSNESNKDHYKAIAMTTIKMMTIKTMATTD